MKIKLANFYSDLHRNFLTKRRNYVAARKTIRLSVKIYLCSTVIFKLIQFILFFDLKFYDNFIFFSPSKYIIQSKQAGDLKILKFRLDISLYNVIACYFARSENSYRCERKISSVSHWTNKNYINKLRNFK